MRSLFSLILQLLEEKALTWGLKIKGYAKNQGPTETKWKGN